MVKSLYVVRERARESRDQQTERHGVESLSELPSLAAVVSEDASHDFGAPVRQRTQTGEVAVAESAPRLALDGDRSTARDDDEIDLVAPDRLG